MNPPVRLPLWALLVALTTLPIIFVDVYVIFVTSDLIPAPASWGYDAKDPIGLAVVGMMFGPLGWILHLAALSLWTWEFTRAAERAGVALTLSASKAAGAWWVPGYNLFAPGRHLRGLAKALAGKGVQMLAVGWWIVSTFASLCKYIVLLNVNTGTQAPGGMDFYVIMAFAQIASFGIFVALMIALQLALQPRVQAAA